MSLEFNGFLTRFEKEWIINKDNKRIDFDPTIILEHLLREIKLAQKKASGLRDFDRLDKLEKHIGICKKHLENNDTGKAAITFFWLGRIAHELEALDTKDKLESWSRKASNNGKKSNPAPINATEYFYECVQKVLDLDYDQQLNLKDLNPLALTLLVDREAHYPLEWKNGTPFKEDWFRGQLKKHPSLPSYLRTNKGKKARLKGTTIERIKDELGI